MSKKIVIDKEVFEQKIKGWIERRTYVRSSDVLELLKDYSTELSTDEGIDERAEKKYPDAIVTINLAKKMRYIEGATEQSLIEQMRAKEFAEWCSINGWYFYTKDNLWRKHASGGFEYKTTEELFNQFTNREKK